MLDEKITVCLKGKPYLSVFDQHLYGYGAEVWPVEKVTEGRMEVAKMRMLR